MLEPGLVESIAFSFKNGKRIRRILPMDSKLVIDQKLPYLCVYRFNGTPEYYIASLLKTQGAYLILNKELDASHLLSALIAEATNDFKSFMIVEIWNNDNPFTPRNIEIWHPKDKKIPAIDVLKKSFYEFNTLMTGVEVSLVDSNKRHPESSGPLVSLDELKKTGTLLIGIALPPLFRDAESQQEYPLLFRRIRRKFARVIKLAAYEFVRVQSDNKFEHYLMLGKTQLDNLVRSADKRISAISEKMDFILRVTPVNSTEEWDKFQRNGFSKMPEFKYRLITLDPEIEKRNLYNIPIENIEHPTLAFLLRDKRMELEKQLIMLEERGTGRFKYTSQSIFGKTGYEVLTTARLLLNDETPNEQQEYDMVNAVGFARAADAEMNKYRPYFPGIKLSIRIKDNVNGLIVSGPNLSIGKHLKISRGRMEALIQHEVGTHILTYCNGHAQPLDLMYAGFAGYEQTQEGIAVLSEYFVGGLDINRLKLLAARVVAVESLIKGADFIETFNLLHQDYGFQGSSAFNISMRVHRGGGYTKDAIYLKGLIELLDFIKKGGNITGLYGGKYALKHLPLIEELTHLKILYKPKLPDYLTSDTAKEKLAKIKAGIQLNDLVN